VVAEPPSEGGEGTAGQRDVVVAARRVLLAVDGVVEEDMDRRHPLPPFPAPGAGGAVPGGPRHGGEDWQRRAGGRRPLPPGEGLPATPALPVDKRLLPPFPGVEVLQGLQVGIASEGKEGAVLKRSQSALPDGLLGDGYEPRQVPILPQACGVVGAKLSRANGIGEGRVQATHLAEAQRDAPVRQVVEVVADRLDGEHRPEGVRPSGGRYAGHHRRCSKGVKALVGKRPEGLSAQFRVWHSGGEGTKAGEDAGRLRQKAQMLPERADHDGLVGLRAKKPMANPAAASAACHATGDRSMRGMT